MSHPLFEKHRATLDRALAAIADRVAVGLARLGVAKNDVVSCQLPNWWQFTVMYLACSRIGAVINPLMHIFRERELSFMLRHGEAKVLVVPKIFRGFDHEAMAKALKPELPHLQRIVVVDGDGPDAFDALLATVQMPPGVPVGTLGVGAWGAKNAAHLALRILALEDAALARRLEEHAAAFARPGSRRGG